MGTRHMQLFPRYRRFPCRSTRDSQFGGKDFDMERLMHRRRAFVPMSAKGFFARIGNSALPGREEIPG